MSLSVLKNRFSDVDIKKLIKEAIGFIGIIIVFSLFFTFFLKGKMATSYFSYSKVGNSLAPLQNTYSFDIPKEYDIFYFQILSINETNVQLDMTVDYGSGSYRETVDVASSLSALDFDRCIPEQLPYTYIPLKTDGAENVSVTINGDFENLNLYTLDDSESGVTSFKTACVSKAGYGIYIFVAVVALIGYAVMCFLDFGKKLEIEKIYLAVVIPMTILFYVLIPSGCANDVTTHIIWTYQQVNELFGMNENHNVASTYMKDGDAFILENVILDSEQMFANPTLKQYAEQFKYMKGHYNTENIVECTYVTTGDSSNVNKIEYLIPFMVFTLARLLNMNFLLAVNLARALNALFFIFIVYQSIKIIPYGKEMVMFIGLLPIVAQTMTTINYDYFAYCLTILGVSIIIRMEQNNFKMSLWDKILIYVIVIVLASAKGGVYLVPFVMFFALKCLFEKEGRAFIKENSIYYFGGAVVSAVAMYIANSGAVSDRTIVTSNVNSFSELIHNPWSWAYSLRVSMAQDLDKVVLGMFGGGLGWDERYISRALVMLVIFLFFMCCIRDGERYTIHKVNAWLGPACVLTLALLIYTVFWLSAGIGAVTLYGIQGRYFVPTLIMIGLALKQQVSIKAYFTKCTLYICTYSYVIYFALNMCRQYLRR